MLVFRRGQISVTLLGRLGGARLFLLYASWSPTVELLGPYNAHCIHHLVLSLERFNPGSQCLNLQEVYAALLPTLVVLSRDHGLQDDVKVPFFSQLPDSIQVLYRPPSFFSLESSTTAPSSSLSHSWPRSGIRSYPGRNESRSFSTSSHFGSPSDPLSWSGAPSFSTLSYCQHQHDRLLLQLLHLGLLSTQRALQFAEAAAYERSRPPVELPTLLSPRVLLDAGATQSSPPPSRGTFGAFSAFSGLATAPGNPHRETLESPYRPTGSVLDRRSDWEPSALSGAVATGGALGEAALEQWRQFMVSFSSDLAASCSSRARRAASGGTFGSVSPSMTARVATAAAAEPKTIVGICTALVTFLTVPFLPDDCAVELNRIPDAEPLGGSDVLQTVAAEPSASEGSSVYRSLTSLFIPSSAAGELPGVSAVLQPLRDQLVLLQRRQQRELAVLPKPVAVAAAVVEFWEAFQVHQSTGLRIRELVWVDGREKTRAKSPFLQHLEGSERLLIAAVRRGVNDINWSSSASCLTSQQRRLLLPAQSEQLQKLQYLLGSRANAAVRTPHRMHSYDKSYDDFTTRFWLWQQFNRLKEEVGGLFLGCCAVAAAAALGGFLFAFLARQNWATDASTGQQPPPRGTPIPPAPQNLGMSSWWSRPWTGLSRFLARRIEGDGSVGQEPYSRSGETGMSDSFLGYAPCYPRNADLADSRLLQYGRDPTYFVDRMQKGRGTGLGFASSPADELVTASYGQNLWGLHRAPQDSGFSSQTLAPLFPSVASKDSNTGGGASTLRTAYALSSHLPASLNNVDAGSYGAQPGAGGLARFAEAGDSATPSVLTPGCLYSGRDELTTLYLALASAGRGSSSGLGGPGRGPEFSAGSFTGGYGG
ncbi:conserved hypothetical protein [Neospora caninum Liverpool]|uniref:Transmembrane protein n=1 Tax=Neospora caninum (strain Liverpool) TaxID=572307 RepID=F0VGX8_NEOCL|nr:conserved hypothetical protein [Neospora caninum Liverpool]CBZ52972.1 conserved hypothetical protein [Neospora caninum Liverpool]|eukprot:XP_003883004.1 conserved hypothetical protein [Neospora caninum Liverpool]